jgi:serine/threonine protein kinase
MGEVATLARLDHPCILSLLTVRPPTADDPTLLIATERIRPGAPGFDPERSPTDTAKVVVGVALGMAYLHSHGVLHYDLKPANVLVDQAMRPRVCGFDETQTTNSGTPPYMAPEIRTEFHYGQPVDVFAWTCTAYELIAGKPALDGSTPFQIAIAARSGARQTIPSGWGTEFARLVERAWAVNPKDSPSFAEILNVVEECGYRLWQGVDARQLREFVREIQRQADAPQCE